MHKGETAAQHSRPSESPCGVRVCGAPAGPLPASLPEPRCRFNRNKTPLPPFPRERVDLQASPEAQREEAEPTDRPARPGPAVFLREGVGGGVMILRPQLPHSPPRPARYSRPGATRRGTAPQRPRRPLSPQSGRPCVRRAPRGSDLQPGLRRQDVSRGPAAAPLPQPLPPRGPTGTAGGAGGELPQCPARPRVTSLLPPSPRASTSPRGPAPHDGVAAASRSPPPLAPRGASPKRRSGARSPPPPPPCSAAEPPASAAAPSVSPAAAGCHAGARPGW